MKYFNKNELLKNQLGFSLVELMVTMFLSLIIMAGLLNLYSSNKSAYRSQESISRIQESYRFASEKIQKELRLAGYYGCNNESVMVNTLSSLPFSVNYMRPVEGFNATNATTWDRDISTTGLVIGNAGGNMVRGGTDILVIRRVSSEQYPLRLSMTNTKSNLHIEKKINPAPFSVDDVLIVSDCKRSAIFQVTGFTSSLGRIKHKTSGGNIGNTTKALVTSTPGFHRDANVMKLDTVVFFIGTSANGTPSLKRKVNSNISETIINGVENMQIFYGLDTDATPDGVANRYVNAESVPASDWVNVTTARIGLLMSSPDNTLSEADTRTYQLLDEPIGHTGTTIKHDGGFRFRQAVQMTVDIRNT